MDPEEVRATIREKLGRGALPREKCLVTWFGPGAGHPCAACERPISRQQIECECEQALQGFIRFHQSCFAVWDEERRQGEPGALRR
jgi:hypothetical protein